MSVVRTGAVEVPLPVYKSAGAAGMDLHAALREPRLLEPGKRALIPTGLRLAIPAGYEGQVRPRSGWALDKGVGIVNSPGTIDSDFRGEIGIVLINHGAEPVWIEPLQRIAQLVIAPVIQVQLCEVDELDTTVRGKGGYGSSGVDAE